MPAAKPAAAELTMPLPIAHVLTGATIAEAILPLNTPHRRGCVGMAGLFALLPDLDFIPVWLLHLERDWHRSYSHSILFAVLIGAVTYSLLGHGRWLAALTYGLAALSHGILDAVTTASGRGVELLWPFLTERFKADWVPLSEPLSAGSPAVDSMSSLIRELGLELAVFLPVLVLVLALRRRFAQPARPSP